MHKIYKIRKLQLKKYKEINENTELTKFYSDVMKYEQAAMKAKIDTSSDIKYPELNDDFDGKIENIVKFGKIKESKVEIEGDYSYNFCVKL